MRYEEARTIKQGHRCDIHSSEPSISVAEAKEASRSVRPGKEKVVAVPHRRREKAGEFFIPEDAPDWAQPDLATVLAVGEGPDEEVSAGDTVVTDYIEGKRIRGLSVGEIDIDGEVRMYGYAGGTAMDAEGTGDAEAHPQAKDWSDGVPAKIVGSHIQATGDKVCYKLPPLEEKSGGIILADSARQRSAMWECVSVGKRVKDVKPGDMSCVHTGAATYFVTENGVEYAVVPEEAVYFSRDRYEGE